MRELVVRYLSNGISRRSFVSGLTKAGLTLTADIVTDRRTVLSILLEPFRRLSGRRSAG